MHAVRYNAGFPILLSRRFDGTCIRRYPTLRIATQVCEGRLSAQARLPEGETWPSGTYLEFVSFQAEVLFEATQPSRRNGISIEVVHDIDQNHHGHQPHVHLADQFLLQNTVFLVGEIFDQRRLLDDVDRIGLSVRHRLRVIVHGFPVVGHYQLRLPMVGELLSRGGFTEKINRPKVKITGFWKGCDSVESKQLPLSSDQPRYISIPLLQRLSFSLSIMET